MSRLRLAYNEFSINLRVGPERGLGTQSHIFRPNIGTVKHEKTGPRGEAVTSNTQRDRELATLAPSPTRLPGPADVLVEKTTATRQS